MAMVQCVFNDVTLPLNFEYQPRHTKRLSVEPTLTADVVQQDTYYLYDETWKFTLEFGTSSLRDTFLTAFKNSTTAFTFTDYDSNSFYVLVTEFAVEEKDGYYNLSGVFKRMEALS